MKYYQIHRGFKMQTVTIIFVITFIEVVWLCQDTGLCIYFCDSVVKVWTMPAGKHNKATKGHQCFFNGICTGSISELCYNTKMSFSRLHWASC